MYESSGGLGEKRMSYLTGMMLGTFPHPRDDRAHICLLVSEADEFDRSFDGMIGAKRDGYRSNSPLNNPVEISEPTDGACHTAQNR